MQKAKDTVEAVYAYVIATVKRKMEHEAAQRIGRISEVKEAPAAYELYDSSSASKPNVFGN